ncbi:MAG: O-antigen ligase family protein [Solirubrobacterales bacterium]
MPPRRRLRRLPLGSAGGGVTAAFGTRWSAWPIWVLAILLVGFFLGAFAAATPPDYAIALAVLPAVVAVLLRPEWLPCLLTVTLFVESLSFGGLVVSRLAGPLALAIVLIRVTLSEWPKFPRREVLWAAGLYCAWAVASTWWTVNPNNGFEEGGTGFAIASLGLSLSYMMAFAFLVENTRDLSRIGVTIWIAAVAVGSVAVVQYLFSGYGRATAYTGDANFFAALQVISIPICIVVAGRMPTPRLRAIGYLGVALVTGSVFVSLSRGGLLGLIGVLVLVVFQPYRTMFRSRTDKRVALAVILIGAGILFYGAFNGLVARGQSLFDTADGGSGRTNLWKAADTGWHEHEIHGLGYGAFPSQSNRLLLATPGTEYSAYKLRPTGQVAHSAYIGTLAELGIVGLALFLGVLAMLIRTVVWARKRALARDDELVASMTTAFLIAIIGFIVVSFFLSTESDRSLWVMLGLALAIARVVDRPLKELPR